LSHSVFFATFLFVEQINLDKDPVEMAISNEVFTMLKRSNASRFQVLTSLFTRLGVDCTKSEQPSLSAIHLMAKSEVVKKTFNCCCCIYTVKSGRV
jgi:hypothetical protein